MAEKESNRFRAKNTNFGAVRYFHRRRCQCRHHLMPSPLSVTQASGHVLHSTVKNPFKTGFFFSDYLNRQHRHWLFSEI